jgi:hypothetical protein
MRVIARLRDKAIGDALLPSALQGALQQKANQHQT